MKKLKKKILKSKKNSLAFTLIELLAVILILGIIALIAIPQVNKAIEASKKGSAEASAVNYIKAANEKIIVSKIDGDKTNDINDGTININDLGIELSSGKAPVSGTVVIKNGVIESATFVIDGFNVSCLTSNTCTASKDEVTYVYYANTPPYNFNSVSDGEENRPNDFSAYLRYPIKNDVIGKPDMCTYSDGSELCIEVNKFESNKTKMISYFGSSNCYTSTSEIACHNSKVEMNAYSNGNIRAVDYDWDLYWNIRNNGTEIDCTEGGE